MVGSVRRRGVDDLGGDSLTEDPPGIPWPYPILGNSVSGARTVIVDDRTAPSLALLGPSYMVHTCNTPWVDPGVTANDACADDISTWVSRTGDVNAWAVGVYTLTYNVTDAGGNSATPVTRTVEVVNCPW